MSDLNNLVEIKNESPDECDKTTDIKVHFPGEQAAASAVGTVATVLTTQASTQPHVDLASVFAQLATQLAQSQLVTQAQLDYMTRLTEVVARQNEMTARQTEMIARETEAFTKLINQLLAEQQRAREETDAKYFERPTCPVSRICTTRRRVGCRRRARHDLTCRSRSF